MLQRFNSTLFLLAIICVLSSCETLVYEGFEQTASGLYYQFDKRNEGAKVQGGDLVKYHLDFLNAVTDEVIFSSREDQKPIGLAIPNTPSTSYFLEAVKLMHLGDSLTILIPRDSLGKNAVPKAYKSGDWVKANFKLLAIDSKSSLMKDFEKSPSGLYYKFHEKTNSGIKPKEGHQVVYHLDIRSAAKGILSSSRDQGHRAQTILPATFPKKEAPMMESIRLMEAGDSLTAAIEIDSLPRMKGKGFSPGELVFFDVVLYEVRTPAQIQADLLKKEKEEKLRLLNLAKEGKEIEKLTFQKYKEFKEGKWQAETTSSGLTYKMHKLGPQPLIRQGQAVKVHYIGLLPDGSVFDESFSDGKPIEFPVGKGYVIKGWDEGLLNMNEGSEATFIIPANLGYGATGKAPKIPPHSELVFFVRVEKVSNDQFEPIKEQSHHHYHGDGHSHDH